MQLTIIVRKVLGKSHRDCIHTLTAVCAEKTFVCVWAEFLCSIYCIAGKFGDELFLPNQGGRQNEKVPLAIDVWHDRQNKSTIARLAKVTRYLVSFMIDLVCMRTI